MAFSIVWALTCLCPAHRGIGQWMCHWEMARWGYVAWGAILVSGVWGGANSPSRLEFMRNQLAPLAEACVLGFCLLYTADAADE